MSMLPGSRAVVLASLAVLMAVNSGFGAENPCLQRDPISVPAPVSLLGLDLSNGKDAPRWRLAGLVPDPPLLETLSVRSGELKDENLQVYPLSSGSKDRYGRTGAVVTIAGSTQTLQEKLLEAGSARFYHRDVPPECRARLISLEDSAILARRGLWSNPRFSLLSAADPVAMVPRLDSYQVVEGRILSIGHTRRRTYLNFGQTWSEDFTVEIPRRANSHFEKAGLIPEDWAGRRVRVRGWLSESRGPMIVLSSPQQIDLIPD